MEFRWRLRVACPAPARCAHGWTRAEPSRGRCRAWSQGPDCLTETLDHGLRGTPAWLSGWLRVQRRMSLFMCPDAPIGPAPGGLSQGILRLPPVGSDR